MNTRIAQPKEIRHPELSLRQHRRADSMPLVSLCELIRSVRAYGQDLDTALVELGPEFFPSPQLGDTIRSPVGAEELDQDGTPLQ